MANRKGEQDNGLYRGIQQRTVYLEILRKAIPGIVLVAILFTVAIAAGMRSSPEQSEQILQELVGFFEPLVDVGPFSLVGFIFVNNAVKTLLVILLGVILGLPSLLFVLVNGYVIGIMTAVVQSELGYGVLIASLAPHGVLEIPAMLLASGLGVQVGHAVLLRFTEQRHEVRNVLECGLKIYARWILPALLVASVIEVLVTPLFIELAWG